MALLAVLTGCGGGDGTPVVASYRDDELTRKQLDFFIPDKFTGEDSARFAEHYIQQWMKEKAICDVALQQDEKLAEEIEFKVEDYRRKLIIHEYTSRLISDSLKGDVPDSEIRVYYEAHQDKFIARENKYQYLYFSTGSTQTAEAEKWLRSQDPADLAKLREWVSVNALESSLDSAWGGETIIKELAKGYFGDLKKAQVGKLIRWNTVILGQRRTYFFKKVDEAVEGSPQPLSLVRDEIRTALMNERKIHLIEGVEEKILRDAGPYMQIKR